MLGVDCRVWSNGGAIHLHAASNQRVIIDDLHALRSAAVVANSVPGVTLTVQLLCPGILWNQGYSVVGLVGQV